MLSPFRAEASRVHCRPPHGCRQMMSATGAPAGGRAAIPESRKHREPARPIGYCDRLPPTFAQTAKGGAPSYLICGDIVLLHGKERATRPCPSATFPTVILSAAV